MKEFKIFQRVTENIIKWPGELQLASHTARPIKHHPACGAGGKGGGHVK